MEATIYSTYPSDKSWPELLRELPEKTKPKSLNIRGTLPPQDMYYLGIVGPRVPSAYGREVTEKIVQALSRTNIVIVSGLAMGIDTVAHESAIKNNIKTVAVVGSGLDESVLYPKVNIPLARNIIKHNGAIISEYKNSDEAKPWTFPERNRIIAGIAHAVLIIEARERSGALITAECALEYNRDVYAVPGSIFNDKSRGTNTLIKHGATPIISPNDIRVALGFDAQTETHFKNKTAAEQKLLELLGEERTFDDMIEQSHLSREELLSTLTMLELEGAIRKIGSAWRKN